MENKTKDLVFILSTLKRTAPNTVIVDLIREISYIGSHKISVVYLSDVDSKFYKEELESLGISTIYTNGIIGGIQKMLTSLKPLRQGTIIHCSTFRSNILGLCLKKLFPENKYVATVHATEDREATLQQNSIMGRLRRFTRLKINRFAYMNFDINVAVSDEVSEYLDRIGVQRKLVVPNGVNHRRIMDFAAEAPIASTPSEPLCISQVGVISYRKNQLFSISLLNYLRENGVDAKLNLFGAIYEEEYYRSLKKYIIEHDLREFVFFHGNLEFDELFAQLSSSNFVILPSRSEGFPLAALEIMMLGLPIIASNQASLNEILKNRDYGFTFDIDECMSSHAKIYAEIENIIELRNRNLYREAIQEFSAKKMADLYIRKAYEDTK